MEYQTLYRRWRPRGFQDFVGQSHVVTTLYHAIENERVAHAYLFTGPRGTGKTSIAKIFGKALNCLELQGADPCGQCSNCQRIAEGTFMDVIEIDAASNRGIDEIRDLREKVRFAPAEGKYKIYIIDEVHMLTTEAFNALLKTLEEPPKFVVFILATTEIHKIPATILSRCQRFDFKRFSIAEITGRLRQVLTAEGITGWTEASLTIIAEYAEGGMRDALGLLEQALAHSQGQLDEDNVRAILGLTSEAAVNAIAAALDSRDTGQTLAVLTQVNQEGKDLYQFSRSLVGHYRNVLLAVAAGTAPVNRSPAELVRVIEVLANATNEIKRSQQSSLPLELALIKLTAPNFDYQALEERVARLEKLLDNATARVVTPAPVPVPVQQGETAAPQSAAAKPAPVAPPVPQVGAGLATVTATTPATGNSPFAWDDFLEAVKKRKRTLAALVQEGTPLQYDEVQLVVGLPPNLKFHLENLAMPQNRELLENVLFELTGKKTRISCIPITDNATPAPEAAATTVPDPVAQAVALFGGEIQPILKEEK